MTRMLIAAIGWLVPALALAQEPLEDIRDIHGPMFEPAPWWLALAPYGIALLVVLVVALAVWSVRRLLRKPKSAEAVALTRIEAAAAIAEPRAFAVEVSEAVRAYVEARFDVRAPRQTTEELLARLADDATSPLAGVRGLLSDFLGECDRAKFGGYALDRAARAALTKAARELVIGSASTPTAGAELAPGGAS